MVADQSWLSTGVVPTFGRPIVAPTLHVAWWASLKHHFGGFQLVSAQPKSDLWSLKEIDYLHMSYTIRIHGSGDGLTREKACQQLRRERGSTGGICPWMEYFQHHGILLILSDHVGPGVGDLCMIADPPHRRREVSGDTR